MFDHPSGRNRILMAMRWKAEQMRQEPGPGMKFPGYKGSVG